MSKSDSPIPQTAQLVLDFFDNELAGVRFPDVDQAVLQEAADRVTALAEEQARAEAALQAAREALQEGQDQLLARCQRALSYARIYAEDDPDLSRRLEAVTIQRGARVRAATEAPEGKPAPRRGRRPSAVAADGALFAEVPKHDDHRNGVAA